MVFLGMNMNLVCFQNLQMCSCIGILSSTYLNEILSSNKYMDIKLWYNEENVYADYD